MESKFVFRFLRRKRRRQWQPTPVLLPGKSHGQRSLAGYSLWHCKELYTTEQLTHIKMTNMSFPDNFLSISNFKLQECWLFLVFVFLYVWWYRNHLFSSVQFSCLVVSYSLRPHESQHARPPCPSPTHRVHSDSRPSSQWCHPAISSSQHQSLFQWVNSSHQVAKVLEFQL